MNWDLPGMGNPLLPLLVAELSYKPHQGVTLFQEIFVPVCSLLALRATVRTWAGRATRVSGFLGILLWSGAAIAIALPELTSKLAHHVGIDRGADLVLYLSILCGLAVAFYFYQRNRQLENLITELVRREAIRSAESPLQRTVNELDSPR
jgi:hypothetical protein